MKNGKWKMANRLAAMPERHPSLCQVVRRQLNGHPVTCQDPDVVLAHLTGQMSQYLMPLAYFYLECSISHTLYYSSINRDHVFFWNDVTSFPRLRKLPACANVYLDFEAK
jgi:hypothetical protein